ncbi:hydroxymethylglutaryl-CoA lyase [Aminiphilus sp.]|uniref:hydroxymethylglutaryl-CoA lyase n=1 Tax=Aminiphilus sp. TaxID=1872488 RepID=UPI0026110508|nr:hydroxymethylglutaryl-CoA lyase [Aminiphilus sp.]
MKEINRTVQLVEVGPRDGFQSIKTFIPTEKKIDLVKTLLAAGIRRMEVTSFVSPKAIPQMADAREVVAAVKAERVEGLQLTALVPNAFGARAALEMELDAVNFVLSVSETHNRENVRRTVDESFAELAKIAEEYAAAEKAPRILLSLATTFGCPFEGPQPVSRVADMVHRAADLGVTRIIFADTIGVADPLQMETFWEDILPVLPEGLELSLHLHDTRGLGLANVYAALRFPVHSLEASFGGFGGCPFAPGAAGNIATEDLVNMLERMGISTGVDVETLSRAALELARFAPEAFNSHMARVVAGKTACCGPA